ncbi:hypothetical protein CHELA1G11_12445 [Hyphomicrobiales bacterium]|nr:hypothetical protein CHELA1G2_11860 [Hyphomicrobiales bacterium]CAH1664885.1 hypothetical protein CHELA1G11_12445 [Hyphomicrobiales bacterium]
MSGCTVFEDMAARHFEFRQAPLRLSCFPEKLGLQNKSLDLLGVAFDLARLACQPNTLHQRAPLDCLGCPLDLEILDQRHRVAVLELVAITITHRLITHQSSLLT